MMLRTRAMRCPVLTQAMLLSGSLAAFVYLRRLDLRWCPLSAYACARRCPVLNYRIVLPCATRVGPQLQLSRSTQRPRRRFAPIYADSAAVYGANAPVYSDNAAAAICAGIGATHSVLVLIFPENGAIFGHNPSVFPQSGAIYGGFAQLC
eukprot:1264724-Rhodomonas_salina.3